MQIYVIINIVYVFLIAHCTCRNSHHHYLCKFRLWKWNV